MKEPGEGWVNRIAESWVLEAKHDRLWIGLLCGEVERRLNILGQDQGHEQAKRVVLKIVAAMVAKGVQADDLDSSKGSTRFAPWEDQSPSAVFVRISDRWDAGKWQAVARYPDPGETGWLFEPER